MDKKYGKNKTISIRVTENQYNDLNRRAEALKMVEGIILPNWFTL